MRFYKIGAAQRTAHAGGGGYHPGCRNVEADPILLEEIPPLVFSEVMRDVDLFVGGASVGNDPTWNDGGPDGRFHIYWQDYSFSERFLIVEGRLRTYKIHLGSGNILMELNDQYLCIVPKQGETDSGAVLLPLEGDRTLSIILSKAFLLADDDKIKDTSILNQIRAG